MLNPMTHNLAIFDLDGVIVDTAKYHYLAWKELAEKLGFEFTEAQNERLKGVSRVRSLEILLEIGGLSDAFGAEEKAAMAAAKNARYVEYIGKLEQDEILPGVREYLLKLRESGVKTAIGSASKNTPMILARLGIADLFDVVIDGNATQKAKPDPEVFMLAGQALGIAPADCIVYEDAQAGIDAALAAGMAVVGVGSPENLSGAMGYIEGFADTGLLEIFFK